ncbi:hypothetical protein HanPSC8_Chr11g0476911 [Helianthus annuus]|nr:hypothetical protein HanPSC8_Chr11g0476911 [Helianthus annuus]
MTTKVPLIDHQLFASKSMAFRYPHIIVCYIDFLLFFGYEQFCNYADSVFVGL